MRKRVGVIQSNYIPWKGYFDFIASVDEFVLFDQVQYTRRDWRNRNKIKTKDGLRWLTIPVEVKGHYFQAIDETRTAGSSWIDDHLAAMRHSYSRAKYFAQTWDWVEPLYRSLTEVSRLSEINRRLIEAVCLRLEIKTPIRNGRDFQEAEGRNERLISICRELGATEYLSGPSASSYIDESLFAREGIGVLYMSYDGYPKYSQLHEPFEHGVTILDVFFNAGPVARTLVIPARGDTNAPTQGGSILQGS